MRPLVDGQQRGCPILQRIHRVPHTIICCWWWCRCSAVIVALLATSCRLFVPHAGGHGDELQPLCILAPHVNAATTRVEVGLGALQLVAPVLRVVLLFHALVLGPEQRAVVLGLLLVVLDVVYAARHGAPVGRPVTQVAVQQTQIGPTDAATLESEEGWTRLCVGALGFDGFHDAASPVALVAPLAPRGFLSSRLHLPLTALPVH
mmetsp:Transcript_30254/g.87915  ORF Transcript_30254/g.87915 Transcript_30254/m.87915 type:complete len:205 (+) Transcript_30254:2295-2909(+)